MAVLAATAPADPDWIWQGSAATLQDGEKDGTAYGQGSSEDTNPNTWSQASADTPKADLLQYYFNTSSSGDVVVSFGFTRASINGDTAFAAEFNQHANGSDSPPQPIRTAGDLLLKFHVDSGNSELAFVHAFLWTPVSEFAAHVAEYPGFTCEERYNSGFGWCEIPRTNGSFATRISDGGFTAEAQVNLSTLFGDHGCSAVFNEVNLRGESSAENWTNSLQDYLPLPGAHVDSTCANLVIQKFRSGTDTMITGAHFNVYVGSSATGTPLYSDVTDGGSADTDGVVGQITLAGIEPGTYTVKETQAPPGYFLPSPDTQTLTVGDSGTATFPFRDVKIWQPLDVAKNGSGSYDVTYDWSIDKLVGADESGPFFESLTKDVAASGDPTSASFGYQVVLTMGAQHTSNIRVTGNLLVDNPNDEAVSATLSDTLDGATCTIDGGATKLVPANAVDNAYGYTCTYPDGTLPSAFDTTNVGHVAWDASTYPQDDGTGHPLAGNGSGNYTDDTPATAITYTAHETNKTVTVTDLMSGGTHHVFSPAWTVTWTAEGTTETRTYTESVSAHPGSTNTVVNTAFVKSGSTTIDQDDATATIRVGANLSVTKVVNESLTREYLWSIDKRACAASVPAAMCPDPNVVLGDPGTGNATAHYTVEVTQAGTQDSAWAMNGTITVTNPNSWEAVTLTGLSDVYSGGGDCQVTASLTGGNPDATINWSIPASGSRTYRYSCTFDSANPPALGGTNTATATWSADAAHTPGHEASGDAVVAEGDWAQTPVNKTVHLYDSLEGATPRLIGSATYGVDASPKVFEYTSTVHSAPGTCTDYDNVAWLSSSGTDATLHVGAPDDASVRVCTAQGLTVSKTATGTYDRTYHWSIAKLVSLDPSPIPDGSTDHATYTGDTFSHLFGYKVTLSQEPWTDSNWALAGTITLTNDNPAEIDPISSTVTDVPNVGADATCRVVGGADDGTTLVGYTTAPIPSGGHLDIGYRCTFASQPDYSGGNNAVQATNASNQPYSVPATFSKTAEHDKTVTVTDDKVTLSTPATLGSQTYDEANPSATYSYDYDLTHTATQAGVDTSFVNHATVLGDGNHVIDTASATAVIHPNPGTWTVAKSSNVGDGAVPVNSDITYTLTAHKTGGVNPTNVVLTDDLTSLAPYVDIPGSFSPSTGSASVVDGVLTWTIPELGSTDETLVFTVHVHSDAFDVHLPNLVTSPGSQNCTDDAAAQAADECTTSNDTPHYLLSKTSDAGATVMPPYLGDPGDTITYTLTVTNDSAVAITPQTMPGATVTDDLSDVADNAHFVTGSISGDGTASISGTTLTWQLPTIPAGGVVHLSYQFQVDADQWNETLRNTATPAPTGGGECDVEIGCSTTTDTPDYTLMQVSKVNAETGAGLAGAEFTLYEDNAPLADPSAPVVGPEDEQVDVATSGTDGLAQFTQELQRGQFLVKETAAPEGYALPVDGDTMIRVIDDGNWVSNDYMSPFEFRDPAEGQLAIVAKQQYEIDPATGDWVLSDGTIDYGQEVKYVVKVAAVGPKIFHDVTVTDYVPGYNPVDTTSTAKATLVDGSAKCTGSLVCNVGVVDGLVTWSAGTVQDAAGTVEMVVRFPDAPTVIAPGQTVTDTLWNVGYLAWDEVVFTPTPQLPTTRTAPTARIAPTATRTLAVQSLAHHELTSNEVVISASLTAAVEPPIVSPPIVSPPTTTLPNTGGPAGWLPYAGLGLVLLGAWLVFSRRARREA